MLAGHGRGLFLRSFSLLVLPLISLVPNVCVQLLQHGDGVKRTRPRAGRWEIYALGRAGARDSVKEEGDPFRAVILSYSSAPP